MRSDLTFENQDKSAFPSCAPYLANDDGCHVDMFSVVADLPIQARDCIRDITVPKAQVYSRAYVA